MDGVGAAARKSTVKLSITLDGLFGADGKGLATSAQEALDANYARGKPMLGDWRMGAQAGNGTAWELANVGSAVKAGYREFEDIDWYWGGAKVDDLANPFFK
jgi:hypothetical protein